MQNFYDDISLNAPRWLMEASPSTDVVVAAEVVVLRNLAGYPFCLTIDADDRDRVSEILVGSLNGAFTERAKMSSFTPLQRLRLSERWIIPMQMAEHPGGSTLLLSDDESESALICGLEHLVMRSSANLENLNIATMSLQRLIDSVQTEFGWAVHPKFGYLSPNPASCGAGIIYSTICHIPAAIITNKIRQIRSIAESNGIQLRDPWAGGFDAGNSFVKLVTQSLVGNEPDDLLAAISMTTEEVVQIEREARHELSTNAKTMLTDKIMRVYGIVLYAKVIELWEFNSLMSTLRLGAAMGILPVSIRAIDEVFVVGQQAHIGVAIGESFTPIQAAITRAQITRDKLDIE